MNKKTSLIIVTSLTATFVALCAAFFSVTGIAKLFAGATMSALIMASALELGKIVGISFLYQYWKEIPKILRAYLTIASVALMLITSIGIYGFLSAAYQVTADKLAVIDQQTSLLEVRKQRYQEELDLYLVERDRLSTSIENLNRGLAGNVMQYVDATTGQLITTTSAANRNALQEQLRTATEERSRLAERIEIASDSITSLELQTLDISINNSDLAAEIGPLRFVSNLTGWDMDQVVNAFAILIVLVFDPLAIALVISVNFLVKYKPEENEAEKIVEGLTNYNLLINDKKEAPIEKISLVQEEPLPEEKTSVEEESYEEPYKVYVVEDSVSEETSTPSNNTENSLEEDFSLTSLPNNETIPEELSLSNTEEEVPDKDIVETSEDIVEKEIKDAPQPTIEEVKSVSEKKNETKVEKEDSNLKRYDEVVSQPSVDWGLIAQFFKYKYGGTPNWMHPNFDWNNNNYNWRNNPLAVQYKASVVDKRT